MSPNPIRIAEGHPCPTCFDRTRLILVSGTWLHVCATCKTVKCQGRVRQLVKLALLCLFVTLNACAGGEADNVPAQDAAKPKTDVTATANAGPDQNVTVGQAVTITGTLSPDGTPICWFLVQKPQGSQARLTGVNLIVTLTPDKPGGYIVSLGCLHDKQYHYYDEMIVEAKAAPVPPVPTPEPPAPTLTVVDLHVVSDSLVINGSMIDGTFSYALEGAPTLVNYGGMANKVYAPLAWHFDTQTSWLGAYTFSSDQAGHTAEVCVGICTWLSPAQIRVNVRDGVGHLLHFSFLIPDGLTTPPLFTQIGAFGQGVLEVEGTTPVTVFRTGTITTAPALAMQSWEGGAL